MSILLAIQGGGGSADVTLKPVTGSLVFSSDPQAVATGPLLLPGTGTLTFAGASPTAYLKPYNSYYHNSAQLGNPRARLGAIQLAADRVITPGSGSLSIVGKIPTIIRFDTLTIAKATLVLTGIVPILDAGMRPASGGLTITGPPPGVSQGMVITPSAGALVLTPVAPSVVPGIVRSIGAGSLVFNSALGTTAYQRRGGSFFPNSARLAHRAARLKVMQLAAQSQSPFPGVGNLSFVGIAPTASIGVTITTGTGSLVLTGVAPKLDSTIVPGAGSLVFNGFPPAGGALITNAGSLILTGAAPVITRQDTITPNVGSLIFNGIAPVITRQDKVTSSAGTLSFGGASNLAQFSEQLEQSPWAPFGQGIASAPVVTANAGLAPDGTNTADRVQFALNGSASVGDIANMSQGYVYTGTPNTTFGVWIKSNTGANQICAIYNVNGQGSNLTITPQWQFFTRTVSSGFAGGSSFGIRTRGGQGMTDAADLLIWGAQLEENAATLGPYVRTTGAVYNGPPAPVVTEQWYRTPNAGTLVFTGFAPVLFSGLPGLIVFPNTGTLVLTANQPTVTSGAIFGFGAKNIVLSDRTVLFSVAERKALLLITKPQALVVAARQTRLLVGARSTRLVIRKVEPLLVGPRTAKIAVPLRTQVFTL